MPIPRLSFRKLSIATTVTAILAISTAFWRNRSNNDHRLRFHLKLQGLDIPFSHTHQLTYLSQPANGRHLYTALAHESPQTKAETPDTTAIVLNWSRLENVLLISTLLCSPQLQGIILRVLVWNNNPNSLSMETFSHTGCGPHNLEIYNSPSNVYFQARFIACARAETPYCFVQDDDYLVRPEIIRTMHSFILKHSSIPSVHLLPPHEHISSRLRTVVSRDKKISTRFAWLGHGTFVQREAVRDFLQLLRMLRLGEDEMEMADNYFTLLANRQTEIWLDHGIELGGGQPFTVGSEGDERNNRYMTRAVERLLETVSAEGSGRDLPYVSTILGLPTDISRSPCLKESCLVESNINMLPGYEYSVVSRAEEMVTLTSEAQNSLGEAVIKNYLHNPLSNTVDDDPTTSFLSLNDAKRGDWITLTILDDLLYISSDFELALLVTPTTAQLLQQCQLSMLSVDAWVEMTSELHCYETDLEELVRNRIYSYDNISLMECAFGVRHSNYHQSTARSVRIELLKDMNHPWVIFEVWHRRLAA